MRKPQFFIALTASVLTACTSILGLRDDYFVDGEDATLAFDAQPDQLLPEADTGADANLAIDGGDASDAANLDGGDATLPDVDAAPPPPGPSCSGLGNVCGPAAALESCCASALVPGGSFQRAEIDIVDGGITNSKPAKISTFRLDKYKVTVARFRNFVNAVKAGWQPTVGSGKHAHLAKGGVADQETASLVETGWTYGSLPTSSVGWDQELHDPDCHAGSNTWREASGTAHDLMPMTCAPWRDALAFCIWDGGFLPTDAEYNYAAVGGNEQRVYPWSVPASDTTISWKHASYGLGNNMCLGDPAHNGSPHTCSFADLTVPGSKALGNGRWGHADLVGIRVEYTMDCFRSFTSTCEDCGAIAEPCGSGRSLRGSLADAYAHESKGTRRVNSGPYSPLYSFRCARVP